MTPLDFAAERDEGTASWRRADPRAALIERTAWNRWVVTLPDSEHAHDVRLERDHGAYVGECYTLDGDEREPCPGNAYHDGPCAHLCTVRKAAFGDVTDTHDRHVDVFDIEDVADARADHAVEKLRADGGRHRRWP
ncbi:hypothetical protein [Haloplanus rubicundus]|uniref:hypothetical protein n=1 Tax=Haloplanus rubicundus TaxID=1547898 RepID=UPI0016510106|nr:hypothetical protein [Haloplanus rubicundus]